MFVSDPVTVLAVPSLKSAEEGDVNIQRVYGQLNTTSYREVRCCRVGYVDDVQQMFNLFGGEKA